MSMQPEVAPIIAVITDAELGDLAEFLYACKYDIAPCGTGGPPPPPTGGQLQGPSTTAFGDQGVGSASATAMLTLVNIGGGTVTVSNVATSNPAEFPIVGNTCTVLTQATSCNISFTFRPSTLGPRSATVTVTSNGLGNPQVYSLTGNGAVANNYEGLWWNAPANSESGWGINFAHQGDIIFATWFTYDTTGKAWWLTMTANQSAPDTYTGTLYQTTGPAFNATPFDPSKVVATAVGTGTLTFSDANAGTFAYTVNSVAQAKALTRQVFGPLPACTFGAQPNLALATNYQDLWWNAPGGSESGWGINFTHQGDIIFATWFTYDLDGTPLWLTATLPKTTGTVYIGTLYRTAGPAFNAVPFNPANVIATPVGSAILAFTDGNHGTFAYTVNGVPGSKQVTRQVFVAPGTTCQ